MKKDKDDQEQTPDEQEAVALTPEQQAEADATEEAAMAAEFDVGRGGDRKPADDADAVAASGDSAAEGEGGVPAKGDGDAAAGGADAKDEATDKAVDEGAAGDEAAAAGADKPRRPRKPKAPPKTIEDRIRNIEGHIGGLNDKLTQMATTAAQQTRAAGADAPTQAQLDAAAGSKRRMDDLKEEFPEWAGVLDDRSAEIRGEIADIKKTIPTDEDFKHQQRLAMIDVRYEEDDRDWRADVNSDDYKAWFKEQPAEVQALQNSAKLRDSYKLLDAFYARDDDPGDESDQEEEPPPPPPPRNQRLRNATTPTRGGSGNRQARAPTEQEAMDAEFNRIRGSRG